MISKFRLDIMEDTSVDLLNGLNEDKRLKIDLVTTVVCVCVCGDGWSIICALITDSPQVWVCLSPRVQSAWLRPGEAASTSHRPHTLHPPNTRERGRGGDGYPAEANSPRKIQTNI